MKTKKMRLSLSQISLWLIMSCTIALLALPFFITGSVQAAGSGYVNITSPSNGDTLGSGDYEITVSYSIDDLSKAKSWEIVVLTYNAPLFAQQGMEINALTMLNFGTRKSVSDSSGTVTVNDSFGFGIGDPEDLTVTAMLISWTDFQGTGIPAEISRDDVNITFIPSPNATTNNSPGSIYVSSSPGNAQIWINGQYQTTTQSSIDNPFGFTDLAPGKYTVVLKKDGYQDYTEVVNLQADQIYTIKATMKQGTTATGWLIINVDPAGANAYINGQYFDYLPGVAMAGIPPGTYNLTFKKDGYDDWNDTITVSAGQTTTVNAELPLSGGGFPVGGVVGGAAAVGVVGGGIALLRGRMKGTAGKTASPAAKDLYQQWWDKATPAQRGNWNSFDDFMNSRLGTPLKGYVNEYGNPSWSSAYNSWKKEAAGTGESFENWVKRQSGNQAISDQGNEWFERNKYARREDIVRADNAVGEAKQNQQRFQRLQEIKSIISGDSHLSSWAGDASNGIVKDGIVDPNKLQRFENTLKRWINRDKVNQPGADYTYSDAYYDTVSQASNNIAVRLGAAYLTGGYSEMALNPLSAVSTIQQSIAQGSSVGKAVLKGYAQSGFELGLGEAGRVVKYFNGGGASASGAAQNVGKLSAELKNELSAVKDLAKSEARVTRNAFMKSTDVAKAGKTAGYELTAAEKKALQLNNNDAFRKAMAENSHAVSSEAKEVIGTAKQKVYQNARNNAIDDVMNQMSKDGINTADKTYMINQTGTHAQAGNPAWNSVKSDFDHTVNFGEAKYNQLYEQRLNTHLEAQGTSSKALDANVYGEGTTSSGAYKGGAKKFVEHYNETTGSDIMIRNEKGVTTITRETPQTSSSLLGKMNQSDVASARSNYQEFFKKDIAKGGDLNSQIVNGSKTVSRSAGQHGTDSVGNYLQNGKMNYEAPQAAKVADRIKNFGETPQQAMKSVGYKGNEQQLFNDFKKIMGVN